MDGDCIQYRVLKLYIDWNSHQQLGRNLHLLWRMLLFLRMHSDDEFVLFLLDCCLLRKMGD